MQDYTDFLSRKARAHGATLFYIGKRYVVSFHDQSISITDEADPSVRNLRNLADMMVAIGTPGLFSRRHFTRKNLELPKATTVRVWMWKNRSALEALSDIFMKISENG